MIPSISSIFSLTLSIPSIQPNLVFPSALLWESSIVNYFFVCPVSMETEGLTIPSFHRCKDFYLPYLISKIIWGSSNLLVVNKDLFGIESVTARLRTYNFVGFLRKLWVKHHDNQDQGFT
jgi:hypothetical protein